MIGKLVRVKNLAVVPDYATAYVEGQLVKVTFWRRQEGSVKKDRFYCGTQNAKGIGAYFYCTPEDLEVASAIEAKEWQRKREETLDLSSVSGRGMTLGSDPEVFVVGENGKVIPSWKFLSSQKEAVKNKASVYDTAVYWDGFQAEWTTKQDTCLAFMVDSMQYGMQKVLNAAKVVDPKAKLTHECLVVVDREELQRAEEKFVELGCKPSLNAWGIKPLVVPDCRALVERSAGMHMHFGKIVEEKKLYPEIVKGMDAVLAPTMGLVLQGLENAQRRQWYGRTGEYRLPKHGLEYRTISSTAMVHPAVVHFCFELGRFVFSLVEMGLQGVWKTSKEEIFAAVNDGDLGVARKIVERNRRVLDAMLGRIFPGLDRPEAVVEGFILKGVKEFAGVEMEKNWLITPSKWVGHSESANCQFVRFANAKVK